QLRLSGDGQAETGRQGTQFAGFRFANRHEVPVGTIAYQLAEHEGRPGIVAGDLVVGDFLLVFSVHDADVGVVEVFQALALLRRLIDGGSEEAFLDAFRPRGQIDVDPFVIPSPLSGQVVPTAGARAAGGDLRAEIDEATLAG